MPFPAPYLDAACAGTAAAARAVVLVSLVAACSGGGGGEPGPPPGLATSFAIEGRVEFSRMPPARRAFLGFAEELGTGAPTGKSTWLTWSTLNDDRHLYVALEWDDDTHDRGFDPAFGPTDFDGVEICFDDDGDGVFEAGEDVKTLVAASVGSLYVDRHATATGEESDRVADGVGKLSWDPARRRYQAELILPLSGDRHGEDAELTNATRYAILLYDHVRLPERVGRVAALHGLGTVGDSTFDWERLELEAGGPWTHPEPPDEVPGLVVFLSDHESEQPEVYAYDPAAGTTERITNAPELYKETLSLSHDRTRVAFHGSDDRDDLDSYEVWVARLDDGVPVRLTDNAWLDGHPAWSPDDERIVYASQRDAGFSLVVMRAENGVELADLTPPAWSDNDPDWLPDGRIVFKTDRFGFARAQRIAVMNGDGTGVRQLSFGTSGSDHDPVARGGVVYFQRFTKNTQYSLDPEAPFVPWDLYAVPLIGGRERRVLGDAWVNWLPIPAPDGRYLLHLKSQGYTDVRLATTDGRDLGRLVPDQTHVRFVDWK